MPKSALPFSELAEINPPRLIPSTLSPMTEVSFIAMPDVSESGVWTHRQTRKLKDVSVGYTSFIEGDVLFAKITPCMENGKGVHALDLCNRVGFGSTEFSTFFAREMALTRGSSSIGAKRGY